MFRRRYVSGFGDEAIELAAKIGDGYWGSSTDRKTMELYERSGGKGPRYTQLTLCWAKDEASARKTAHKIWPTTGIPGQLAQDLPTWTHFEQAAELVTEEKATNGVPCGPSVEPYVKTVREHVDAGYTHLYFHQIGPDQEDFFKFWTDELQPALRHIKPAKAA